MKKLLGFLIAVLILSISLIPTTASASDGDDPLGLIPGLKRVSIYTDEEVARVTELLVKGTITRPPGREVLGRPVAPGEGPRLVGRPDSIGVMQEGIAAGYQMFGGVGKPNWAGGVVSETWTIPNLVDNHNEWMVEHQWGRRNDGTDMENCIVITRGGSTATFWIFLESLGGHQEQVNFPASHTFRIGIQPQHNTGMREYTRVLFWIWDLTNGSSWSNTYNIPQTELIKDVDAALEQPNNVPANSLWVLFSQFRAYDEYLQAINLAPNFWWLEWESPTMNNEHSESFYGTTGYLYQRKTPK